MKIGFYASYIVKHGPRKEKEALDLTRMVASIATTGCYINIGVNHLYLHKIDDKTYLFTKTNNKSLVQKINKSKLSVEDIKHSLADDESLGFPSFVYISEDIVGFARTIYGPTTNDFMDFVMAHGAYSEETGQYILEPLMRGTTKADVMKMQFIGRTTIKTESSSGIARAIFNTLGATNIDVELLDSIEITIKPKFKRNIKELTKQIVANPNAQYSDVSMKAKDEAGDILADHYLSEKGHLSASLDKLTNAEIAEEINYCFIRMKSSIHESLNRQIGTLKTKS